MQCLVEVVQDGELVLIILRPGKPLQQAPPNPQVHRTALLLVQLPVSSLQQQRSSQVAQRLAEGQNGGTIRYQGGTWD
jgi:hypothetical protein